MNRRIKLLLFGCLVVAVYVIGLSAIRKMTAPGNLKDSVGAEVARAQAQQTTPAIPRPSDRRQRSFRRQNITTVSEENKNTPIRSLHTLRERGSEDGDLSSLILQNELIKKDP